MAFDPQFKYRNLPDQLAEHIVVLLATGELEPGQRLYEKDICEKLGVSRIPVREALRILQAQGVVRTEPNRGTFITEFGSDETAEMLDVRVTVERIALRRILKRVSAHPELTAELREAVEDMRRSAKLGDKLAYCRADLAFHSRLIDLSESPLLRPLWDSLSRGVLVFLMQERSVAFDYQASLRDHEVLVELIEQRKRAALEQEIERHITGYLQRHREDSRQKVLTAGEPG
ncbi:DNA-binding GntR family transcriptional regulator [Rhizobium mesoamericanum]|uniref:GntR family transcriptional regulator n=1 Tax=Rhizobium mesoamericanum TaxID=1079800 RepID=UPI0027852765|nr:GntR family transcriptional regulator [Rhizobium mesoamericanum]MDQ0563180.1 DNA-binding GntR family transcriptional regulator [Rhizobium mesoamericanum]